MSFVNCVGAVVALMLALISVPSLALPGGDVDEFEPLETSTPSMVPTSKRVPSRTVTLTVTRSATSTASWVSSGTLSASPRPPVTVTGPVASSGPWTSSIFGIPSPTFPFLTMTTTTASTFSTTTVTITRTPHFTGTGALLRGECATAHFTLIGSGQTSSYVPFIGCDAARPYCCPWEASVPIGVWPQPKDADQAIVKECPGDYYSTLGICCPNSFTPLSTDIAGATPCYSRYPAGITPPPVTVTVAAQATKTTVTVTNTIYAMQFVIKDDEKNGLSPGGIAGVVVGVLSVLFVGIFIRWYLHRRNKAKTDPVVEAPVLRDSYGNRLTPSGLPIKHLGPCSLDVLEENATPLSPLKLPTPLPSPPPPPVETAMSQSTEGSHLSDLHGTTLSCGHQEAEELPKTHRRPHYSLFPPKYTYTRTKVATRPDTGGAGTPRPDSPTLPPHGVITPPLTDDYTSSPRSEASSTPSSEAITPPLTDTTVSFFRPTSIPCYMGHPDHPRKYKGRYPDWVNPLLPLDYIEELPSSLPRPPPIDLNPPHRRAEMQQQEEEQEEEQQVVWLHADNIEKLDRADLSRVLAELQRQPQEQEEMCHHADNVHELAQADLDRPRAEMQQHGAQEEAWSHVDNQVAQDRPESWPEKGSRWEWHLVERERERECKACLAAERSVDGMPEETEEERKARLKAHRHLRWYGLPEEEEEYDPGNVI
ncbi:hypothetical protein VTJ49DRAFT_6528 [Mycothermus thermophilus]|uniref:Uncharacterized protein n=1 Tax=Humicola insolens TaxID=85995 RepID=A0ABR3VJC8_HUMIN